MDELFARSLVNTVYYTALHVPGIVVIASRDAAETEASGAAPRGARCCAPAARASDEGPVQAVVDERLGAGAVQQIERVPHAVLLDRGRGVVRTRQHRGRFLQAVLGAQPRVVPLDDGGGADEVLQEPEQEVAPPCQASAHARPREYVAEAVDREPGQAVALGVDEPVEAGVREGGAAERERDLQTCTEEVGRDGFVRVGRQEPHGDDRLCVVESLAVYVPVRPHDLHDVACLRLALDVVDQVLEDPRIALPDELVLVAAEDDAGHRAERMCGETRSGASVPTAEPPGVLPIPSGTGAVFALPAGVRRPILARIQPKTRAADVCVMV